MPLGTVLVNNKPLSWNAETDSSEIFDVLVSFVELCARHPEQTAAAFLAAAEESGPFFRDFALSKFELLRFAEGKFRNLFKPFGDIFIHLANEVQEGIPESVPAIVQAIKSLAERARSDKITALLTELFSLLENDMGINDRVLQELAAQWLQRIAGRLERDFIGGDASDQAKANYEFAGMPRDMFRLTMEDMVLPDFSFPKIIQAVQKLWAQKKIDVIIDKVLQVLDPVEDIVGPLSQIAKVILNARVSANVSAGGSVGAALADNAGVTENPEQPICYYASWLLGTPVKYGPVVNAAESPYFSNNPWLPGVSFLVVSEESMEKLTFHMEGWVVPFCDFFLHSLSIEQGDIWSNLTNMMLDVADGTLKMTVPFGYRKYSWVKWLTHPILNFFAGFEGGRFKEACSNDPYLWTNLLGDLGEAALYRRWTWLVGEFVLGFFTLINNDQDAFYYWCIRQERDGTLTPERLAYAKKIHNHNAMDGYFQVVWEGFSWVIPSVMAADDKKNYGMIGGTMPGEMAGFGFIGVFVTFIATNLSMLFSWIAPRDWLTDMERMFKQILRERVYFQLEGWGYFFMPIPLMEQWIFQIVYRYLCTNNNTDDGTYCVLPNMGSEDYKFPGYTSDHSASPYLLPFEKDKTHQCVQNHMGIWSHYPESEQTYAVDYGHDAGEEVLCSREGIVSGIRDSIGDNIANQGWNFVEVMHLIVYPPGSTEGSPAVLRPPAGVANFRTGNIARPTTFSDAVAAHAASGSPAVPATAIPNDALFPPYWNLATDGTGSWDLTLGFLPPLHPSACILPSGPMNGFAGFPAGTRFGFLDPAHDRGISGKKFPAGKKFADNTTNIPAGVVFLPDVQDPPPLTEPMFPEGTTFAPFAPPANWYPANAQYDSTVTPIPPLDVNRAFQPLTATFMSYGHAINSFMAISAADPGGNRPDKTYADIYPSCLRALTGGGNSREVNRVLGFHVPQGRLIMYSGDTGISAYNHLHSHVITRTGTRWTIPFLYRDAEHTVGDHGFMEAAKKDGLLRAMTYYTGTQTRIYP